MKNINSESDLRNAIIQLEVKQTYEREMLNDQFHLAYNGLKPINLIKNTLKQAAASQEIKNNILNTAVGLSAGYFSKLLFERISTNPFKKILGSALLFVVTNMVTKNPATVKLLGNKILSSIRNPDKKGCASDINNPK